MAKIFVHLTISPHNKQVCYFSELIEMAKLSGLSFVREESAEAAEVEISTSDIGFHQQTLHRRFTIEPSDVSLQAALHEDFQHSDLSIVVDQSDTGTHTVT